MKIFKIGFNKCGTSTLHRYLRANGVKSIHWDEGRIAQRMFANPRPWASDFVKLIEIAVQPILGKLRNKHASG